MLKLPAIRAPLPCDQGLLACLLLAILAWILVLLPPFSLHNSWAGPAILGYTALSPVCHQLSGRSFHWLGFPMAICSRCTGLLLGFTLVMAFSLAFRRGYSSGMPRRRWLIGSGFLLLVDALAPVVGLYDNTHFSRVLTGLLFGMIAMPVIRIGFGELVGMFQCPQKGKAVP